MLTKIETLVKGSGHLVLSTCSGPGSGPCAGARPHASLMRFAAAPETPRSGGEFWLATLADTRKYSNLRVNPCASLLLDDRAAGASPSLALTVEALHRPFADASEQERARAGLLARHADMADFLALPGVLVIRLVPLRYQLLSGLTEIFVWEPEKSLDARPSID